MSARNVSIDIARGIGIFLVVWGHTFHGCPVKNEIFLFHMPLFFMLSGFFFKETTDSFIEVLKKKIQSYLFPYIFFLVLCLALASLLYQICGVIPRYDITPVIVLRPGGVVTALWFLVSLFEVQILCYLLFRCFRKEVVRFIVCLLCLLCGYVLYRTDIHLPLFLDSSLSMLLFFYVGYLLHRKEAVRLPVSKQLLFVVVGLCFYVIAVLCHYTLDIKDNRIAGNLFIITCSAIGASYCILILSRWLSKKCSGKGILIKVLSYLGRNTMVIFALHILSFEIARYAFHLPLGGKNIWEGLSLTVLAIVLSLIIGYPLNKYLLPYLKFPNRSVLGRFFRN